MGNSLTLSGSLLPDSSVIQDARLNQGFPGSSAGKESTYNVGDLGLIPGLGRSPGEVNGYLLQCSGLENSMDCIESMGSHTGVGCHCLLQ